MLNGNNVEGKNLIGLLFALVTKELSESQNYLDKFVENFFLA